MLGASAWVDNMKLSTVYSTTHKEQSFELRMQIP
eukprot:COSAG04_NODE_30897_length_260_cov_0.633540_1_plen_33_part_01